ncbi:hypothetical protein FD755_019258 [Muntiacus reevesi]|uniref:Uncharacterized protein n=2 Tax=Muntiacus TaxID=9885 RepID=A0A5N3X557_MUNRE|nr:hypothetical protein FD754_011075 [Muntiacus muntjak]KAB0369253.1 hypothetical protein FD755_019258 [Muntiacus reevesi]
MALARAWKQMSWFYYQYLLVTALYMLEPWERTVFNCTQSWLLFQHLRHLCCFTSFIIVGVSFQTWNLRTRMHILDVKYVKSECKACSSFLNHLLVAVV